MTEYIKKEDAKERTNQLYHGDEVEAWLESLPTIEITQCRDCKNRKHRVFEVDGEGICTEICLMFGKIIFNEDEFCNYGRKESDEE